MRGNYCVYVRLEVRILGVASRGDCEVVSN